MPNDTLNSYSNQNKPGTISVLLADDHPVVRKALRSELNKEVDFQVVGEASDGEEVVRLVNELAPDVVIMDIGMPKLNGLEATRTSSAPPALRVLAKLAVSAVTCRQALIFLPFKGCSFSNLLRIS